MWASTVEEEIEEEDENENTTPIRSVPDSFARLSINNNCIILSFGNAKDTKLDRILINNT